jgi:hypothetical protein
MGETSNIIAVYLDIMVSQRMTVFKSLQNLDDRNIWQRPFRSEWSIGEILDHTRAVNARFLWFSLLFWRFGSLFARGQRKKPYETRIDDVYQRPGFPMHMGWLWSSKYSPSNPSSYAEVKRSLTKKHNQIYAFFESKNPDLLGHVRLYDPAVGRINLIQVLRIGIYHDQLHYRDVIKLAEEFKANTTPVA